MANPLARYRTPPSITTEPMSPPCYAPEDEEQQSLQDLRDDLRSVAIAPPSSATIPDSNSRASGSRNRQRHIHDPQTDRDASQTADDQDVPNSPGLSTTQPVEQPSAPQVKSAAALDQLTAFWEKYNMIGDKEDKEFVASAGGDLDNLLIFAGLFSAIDTAFIIESYKGLKPDPAEDATRLLRSVVLLLQNHTYTEETITPLFIATARDVRVNCLLFTSLCCSLSAAFGAVLAKQWLTQYDQDGGGLLKTPAHRGRERQGKYEGRSKWHLEDVIVTLPTLLQFSLFFFLVGLADFIWPLNTPVASIIIAFTAATFLFYTITISISVIDCTAPFQTRLSALLTRTFALLATFTASFRTYITRPFVPLYYRLSLGRRSYWTWPYTILLHLARVSTPKLCKHIMTSIGRTYRSLRTGSISRFFKSVMTLFGQTYRTLTTRSEDEKQVTAPKQSAESRCIVHLLERMTVSEDLYILAEAVHSLPENSGAPEIAATLATFHLRPILNGHKWSFPGLHGPSRGAMMKMLRTVLGSWEYFELSPTSVHYTPLLNDLRMRQQLVLAVWNVFLAHPEDQEVYDSTRQIFLALSFSERSPTASYSGRFLSQGSPMTNLNVTAAQEHTFRLVSLLPSIGCDLDSVMALLRRTTSESPQLVDMIQSTMWNALGHKPDLEIFWVATFRAEVLSSHRLNTLADSRFPEYLANWFKHFTIPDWSARFPDAGFRRDQCLSQQVSLYWTYLFSLRRLLKHSRSRTWSQELVATGHLPCLSLVLQGYTGTRWFCGEPLGLWVFLCLWILEEAQDGPGPSLLLTKDCVQLVVKSAALCSSRIDLVAKMGRYNEWLTSAHVPVIWASKAEVVEDVIQMLDWLFTYLEAARAGGLMDEGLVESTVQVYSHWWSEVNSLLPEDRQHADRSGHLRTILLRDSLP